eukprot:GHVN01012868.1.p1 GENE.GHVN01012868.1~~GHVN01012868.1.p1  ORF type:complete len:499 (-),score=96.00 GHVN01012868.1:37-1533(-)
MVQSKDGQGNSHPSHVPENLFPIPRGSHHEDWIWKKNVPFLYDNVLIKALPWASLVSEWLQSSVTLENAEGVAYVGWPIVLSTYTPPEKRAEVQLTVLRWPIYDEASDLEYEEDDEMGDHVIVQRLPLPIGTLGVRCARKMVDPSVSSGVAAMGLSDGSINLYDFSKPLESVTSSTFSEKSISNSPEGHLTSDADSHPPNIIGQTDGEITGLAWSNKVFNNTHIAASSSHGCVCVWNVESLNHSADRTGRRPTQPHSRSCEAPTFHVPHAHHRGANDVEWLPHNPAVVLSVGHDGNFCVWDTRASPGSSTGNGRGHVKPQMKINLSNQPLLAISHTCDEGAQVFATGGYGDRLDLWDLRFMKSDLVKKLQKESNECEAIPLLSLKYHRYGIADLQFHPNQPSLLISKGLDNRVCVWDVAADPEEVGLTKAELSDGPCQVVAVHGGHRNTVLDCRWCPFTEGGELTVASSDADNMLEVWTVSEGVFCDEDDELRLKKLI